MNMKEKKENVHRDTAVALKYRIGSDSAPRLVAKGKGEVAQKIIEIAKAHKVPIKYDPQLTEALSHIKLNEMVPEYLYAVIAEVLAWVYTLEKKAV
jgi:flagellar biosynthesis protein